MSKEVVFDLETEKSFDEVGGRGNVHLLGVTVVGVYDYNSDTYRVFEKEDFKALADFFKGASRIIGFNVRAFDVPVLAPHVDFNVFTLPLLDLMDDVEKSAGFRVSLDNLSKATIGSCKSGHGLDAIQWWREGRKDEVKKYCLQDVRLTRDLYEFGKKEGYVFFESRTTGARSKLPVSWKPAAAEDVLSVLQNGFLKRKTVAISYLSAAGASSTERLVDIYAINQRTFEGYCHLRSARRIFTIDGVTSAKITDNTYKIQEDVQQRLIS
ncbi:MAG: hypothetical protein A3C80_04240 [Candidatus Ryanbacteria bacterium RIFCSPHIGHO2_02_FULL_45_43]|uniref:Uncharacterized protein n=1 Tax=Candidatus Ryanbacteria bacterium RIFCSPHIGHO2_01_45_13 TaxID=1802112 RepID=A0A1G2FYX3_9BACT|nr:MAG: hypothetical protein A2718_00270 [Candidatus Ryanbacteria bacterium RIFCSPHIGHO2_01_FULL_44_130]OGZ42810.1 MAG: hypothetical protein A2W41_00640 [Candidatus Ryanbacteria bacterium RIFCSPHIGHO2_01_45_13]OGZ48244.1 MAG: hypothetical protein A3C80_04240 [Candidatus Ryanbacteria bacterium RIFCSPHIGHO2_02_FULL_45_43]OGZ50020.1 MAG: hypothetical protein A3E55_01900 [Candidatus Ryanbacteria bacterium RIFCSPHIGHO2_12_FULL_44_20]OGZ51479.1 MAG: hypothetical protein A3A17_01850 [Candidatus Ryanba